MGVFDEIGKMNNDINKELDIVILKKEIEKEMDKKLKKMHDQIIQEIEEKLKS